MNVTFHTLTALATAAVFSSANSRDSSPAVPHVRLSKVGGCFVAGVLLHGLLDFLPHNYPINSGLDVLFSVAMFSLAMAYAKPQYRILIAACFLGVILPDLIDLGPGKVNNRLGWKLPIVKIFPWHWRTYSGSIYDGSRMWTSLAFHLLVAGLSGMLLLRFRHVLFISERASQT